MGWVGNGRLTFEAVGLGSNGGLMFKVVGSKQWDWARNGGLAFKVVGSSSKRRLAFEAVGSGWKRQARIRSSGGGLEMAGSCLGRFETAGSCLKQWGRV